MPYSFKSVIECVINVIPNTRGVACSEEALELLGDFKEIILPEDKLEGRCDLMLACGKERVNAHILFCDTIVVDGNRDRTNAIDFSVRCKFKSLGYTTLMFDNDNVAVYTKNDDLVSALSRRPFEYAKSKPKPPAVITGILPFTIPTPQPPIQIRNLKNE